MEFKKKVVSAAKISNIKITQEQAEKFEIYTGLLLEWNQKINLTSIIDEDDIINKHIVDSLLFFSAVRVEEKMKVIDVGTGAGFPGLPIKIIRPDIEIFLLDSTAKKLKFISEVSDRLGLKVNTIHKRAEEAGRDNIYRESFDIATARAVAPLPVLSEYCIPLIKMKGKFVALKGPYAEAELVDGTAAVTKLGCKLSNSLQVTLKGAGERNIFVFQKRKFTPPQYPRHGNTIGKHPILN